MKTCNSSNRRQLAIVGSGASATYLLKRIADSADRFRELFEKIVIFEKGPIGGTGMPYSPLTTDLYHLSNISSDELPELDETFADWLRDQSADVLVELGVPNEEISEDAVYSRIALGSYLHAQFRAMVRLLGESGIDTSVRTECEVVDIVDRPDDAEAVLVTAGGERMTFGRVAIATGHYWLEEDRRENGYYASPWPIKKLVPETGEIYNFPVGTIGASLSAFDVVTSLSRRHGDFEEEDGWFVYRPFEGTGDFKLILHAGNGLLPHLQYDQEEPFREIYRQVDRDGLLALVGEDGWLRLKTYYNEVCRPALAKAFDKDGMADMSACLRDPDYSMHDFIAEMTGRHDYRNAFKGMRVEMKEARESVIRHRPIHWKETLDDLIYTLNYHSSLFPAEDHIVLQSDVMPFLMNIIAAMPLDSARVLLALHDAGKLELVSGKVTVPDRQKADGITTIEIDNDGEESCESYRIFVNCSGQKPLEAEEFPFPSLVRDGAIRAARARFADRGEIALLEERKRARTFEENGETFYRTGGVDIDAAFRLIGLDGGANPRIHDIAFPHTTGVRPYSYGLQACAETAGILAAAWLEELDGNGQPDGGLEEMTRIYEEV